MTLNTYADVDPEAKMSAVDKIEGAFDSQARIIPMQHTEEPQTDLSIVPCPISPPRSCGYYSHRPSARRQ